MIKIKPPVCFGSNPSAQDRAENCCDDCPHKSECLPINPFIEQRRLNNAGMAKLKQSLSWYSYAAAREAYRNGRYRMAAYYQRQGERDHRAMTEYLKRSVI